MENIVAEAWCDRNLYICSWFDERTGIINYLNVLSVSRPMKEVLRGDLNFEIEGKYKIKNDGSQRKQLYFIRDGIYFIGTLTQNQCTKLQGEKKKRIIIHSKPYMKIKNVS